MIDLSIHHLWCTVEAVTPIWLPAESGPALRGALIGALRQHYCPDATFRPAGARIEENAEHRAMCPVCWLIAEEDARGERGRNIPRPYTIEPPLRAGGRIDPGDRFSFGVSLIGKAVNLFPYLVLALPEMGRAGVGSYDPRQRGRGRFVLRSVFAVNPLSGARQPLLGEGMQVSLPAVPVQPDEVARAADALASRAREAGNLLGIRFQTPTRIVSDQRLVGRPSFGPFFQRLTERVESLTRYYGSPGVDAPGLAPTELLALADAVEVVEDHTRWVEVTSGSKRLGRATPVSGYEGRVVYRAADWTPLLPGLLWGQSVHVGKNAVKGDGWFSVEGGSGWSDGPIVDPRGESG